MEKRIVDPSHAFLELPKPLLEPFFNPKSVALIGATKTPHSVGNTLTKNLMEGKFSGKIFLVNPKYDSLFDQKCYPSIEAIADEVELVVIMTPAMTVPALMKQCAQKKIKAAIIISAGFKELGSQGLELENEVLKIAKAGSIRLVGPNCLGIMNPMADFNATFAATMALKGSIAFISQSGALCTAVLDWSIKQEIGFSAFVSVGSMADVNWGDLIDYLGNDPNTKVILIYMETIGNAKNFLSAAKEVVLNKPIIVIKAGRSEAAAKAAASHTGSMVGSDDVFDAAMRRVGVLRVNTIEELFDLAFALSKQPVPKGPRLAILTNAGGPAVLATDATVFCGAEMASLSPESIEKLNQFLPTAWSHFNPVDLLGDAGPERYAQAIDVIANDPNNDGILVILTPQDMTDVTGTAKHLTKYAKITDKPLLASWMGGETVQEGILTLITSHIPTFSYPESACKTFAQMWSLSKALQLLYETPALGLGTTDVQKRRGTTNRIIQNALQSGRKILTEDESKQILDAYSIPIVKTIVARSPQEAVKAAIDIGFPVVLKLHSETITHKTDVGGVLLNLHNEKEVEQGFKQIQQSVAAKAGAHHFFGVTVQQMMKRDGYEIILGSSIDAQFGPVVLFGTGGQLVEVYKDRALGLPPLTSTLAHRLMERTKIYQALKGVRGKKEIDFQKLENIVVAFSELIVSHPHIVECDINPLLVSSDEMVALDARIVLSETPLAKSVIRPYPSEYITECQLASGVTVTLRPIRPADEPLVIGFQKRLSEKTIRGRYFGQMPLEDRIAYEQMIRVCHTDYDRELLIIAEYQREMIAALRLVKLPGGADADLKLVIQDSMQRKGLGSKMIRTALSIAKKEGIQTIHLQLLKDNEAMKKMALEIGFKLNPSATHPSIVNGFLKL